MQCSVEARWAASKINCIPLMMQRAFRPQSEMSWLSLLIGRRVWYAFWPCRELADEEKFQQRVDALAHEISHRGKRKKGSSWQRRSVPEPDAAALGAPQSAKAPPAVVEPSNIFTIFSPPEPVRHGPATLQRTPTRGPLASARSTAIDDVDSDLEPAAQAQTTAHSPETLRVSWASNRTPLSVPSLSSAFLTASTPESPSTLARQLGGHLEHEIDKQRREIADLRTEAAEARSQAMLAKEQEAAAIDRAAAQARAAAEEA